jgi:hypothetical protein
MRKATPIETFYRGYRFRSRLEARWAVFFEHCKQNYIYEDQGFVLPSGPYLPDFFFPEHQAFVEVKPLIQLPTRCFEFGPLQSRWPIDDQFPPEIIAAIELVCLELKDFIVVYGDPFDVINDGTAIRIDRDGPRIGIGFIDLFPASLFAAADAARGARFEHGEP